MSNATHRTSLGAVLTLITGAMVCPLDEFYALQDFLVGRSLMTHERTTGWDRQAAALLEQFPRLAEVEAPDFSAVPTEQRRAACEGWVSDVAAHVGWSEAEVQSVDGCEVDAGEALGKVLAGMTRRRSA